MRLSDDERAVLADCEPGDWTEPGQPEPTDEDWERWYTEALSEMPAMPPPSDAEIDDMERAHAGEPPW